MESRMKESKKTQLPATSMVDAVDNLEDQGGKSDEEDGEKKNCCHQFKGKGSIGYLNLLASLIHNFLDGLAIGVGFSTGHAD